MILYSKLSDDELAVLLRDGDKTAFSEIYHRYKGILHVHAYKKLGDFEEAKDVIQDLFSTLWLKHKDMPLTTNISGYLYITIRNKIFNIIAHKKVISKYTDSITSFIDENNFTTDLIMREKDLASIIEKEINALPPKMREVFILSRRKNMSHKEIANTLGVSEHTVKNQIKSSLKILRTKLGLILYLALLLKF
ncbi:RNA polymerase sigma-70 factor [Pedobacter sp. WC2423]|uniref:RNA polymerase sigma-70 factor n=1 Tax=Pedobacter sp. WC2423 TaxID=3234142 RepID=UPI003465AD26